MHILDRLLTLNPRLISGAAESPSFCGLEPSADAELGRDPSSHGWPFPSSLTNMRFIFSAVCSEGNTPHKAQYFCISMNVSLLKMYFFLLQIMQVCGNSTRYCTGSPGASPVLANAISNQANGPNPCHWQIRGSVLNSCRFDSASLRWNVL